MAGGGCPRTQYNYPMEKDKRTHLIIGAAMEVHKFIGPGLLEAVYHECLEIEFGEQNIPFHSQSRLDIFYKERKLKKYYIPDFLVFHENCLRN